MSSPGWKRQKTWGWPSASRLAFRCAPAHSLTRYGKARTACGEKATVGASDINSAYNGMLTSEKHLFSGVRNGGLGEWFCAGAHNRSQHSFVVRANYSSPQIFDANGFIIVRRPDSTVAIGRQRAV